MRNIIKIEELAMFLLSVWMFGQTDLVWWLFPALLLAPDIAMVGYGINAQFGALCYNIFHHKAVALFIFGLGLLIENQYCQFAGSLLFGHSSLDRIFGYGLKYADSFQSTHLGKIGQN